MSDELLFSFSEPDKIKEYSSFSIADWFLSHVTCNHKKLQKLCYYARAWSLALRRQRIISGDFEAWAHKNKLVIKNFGPIEQCELDSSSFSVLAGHQTLDMSGVAKCVYFFRTVKNVLRDVIVNGNPSSNTEIFGYCI